MSNNNQNICEPPHSSTFKSENNYRKHLLENEITFAFNMTVIFCVIFILLLILVIYFVYTFINVVINHYKKKNQLKEYENNILQNSGSDIATFSDKQNDNEKYNNIIKHSERKSDLYSDFTNSIEKTIDQYHKYNQKIRNYFQTNYNEKPPDIIDSRILTQEFDDW